MPTSVWLIWLEYGKFMLDFEYLRLKVREGRVCLWMSKGYWIRLIFMWSLEMKEKGVVKKRRILCRIMKKRRKVGGRTLDFSGLWIRWGMQLNCEEQLIKIRFSHLLPNMNTLKVGMCTTNVSMMTLRFKNKCTSDVLEPCL